MGVLSSRVTEDSKKPCSSPGRLLQSGTSRNPHVQIYRWHWQIRGRWWRRHVQARGTDRHTARRQIQGHDRAALNCAAETQGRRLRSAPSFCGIRFNVDIEVKFDGKEIIVTKPWTDFMFGLPEERPDSPTLKLTRSWVDPHITSPSRKSVAANGPTARAFPMTC